MMEMKITVEAPDLAASIIKLAEAIASGPDPNLLTPDEPRPVASYTVEMTTMPEYHETEETSGGAGDAAFASHKHRYQGKKKWKVHNALQMGEKVILIRCDGGQQYIVLGRWEART